jgi:hypothetical protein
MNSGGREALLISRVSSRQDSSFQAMEYWSGLALELTKGSKTWKVVLGDAILPVACAEDRCDRSFAELFESFAELGVRHARPVFFNVVGVLVYRLGDQDS